MTKQELIDGIYEMDPSYVDMKIDLNNYSIEALQLCYDRKKFAPESVKERMRNYGRDRSSVPVTTRRTEVIESEPEQKNVSLTGFDALKKES